MKRKIKKVLKQFSIPTIVTVLVSFAGFGVTLIPTIQELSIRYIITLGLVAVISSGLTILFDDLWEEQ